MTIIKMCEIQEKWDVEFFRAYVPALVAELTKSESTFQQFVHCLSEFHHRVSAILMEQPPRFKVGIAQQLHQQIRNIASQIHEKNKAELFKLGSLVKQFKGSVYELFTQFKDNQTNFRDIQTKKTKIEQEYEKYKKQHQQITNIALTKLHKCKYYKAQPIIDLTSGIKQCEQRLIQQKVQKAKLQYDQIRAKQQLCYLQQNNCIRICLQRLNKSIQQIGRYQKCQNFQTFNREYKKFVETNKNKDRRENSSNKISQFVDDQVNKIIGQAEINCDLEAYGKIKSSTAQRILDGAILAVSKDSLDFHCEEKLQIRSSNMIKKF